MLDDLFALANDLVRRFPQGHDPFQIMTCLLEESGELAQQVNHFEGSGIKRQKYGAPDKAKMAKEIKDVIRAALRLALYYGIEKEVEESFQQSYRAMHGES